MSENNPYQTPQSNLQEVEPSNAHANPNWDMSSSLSEAWQLVSGFKATLWGALLMYIGVLVVVSVPFEFIGKDSVIMIVVSQLVISLVSYPLSAGMTMLGIKRSVGESAGAFTIFDYYSKAVSLLLLYVLMMILIAIGLVLLVIPGIYLSVAYSLAMPLMVEKNMGIWEALEASRKAIHKRWFEMFGLYIILIVILIVASLLLGIGLIWAVPFSVLVLAVVYRNMFGVGNSVQV